MHVTESYRWLATCGVVLMNFVCELEIRDFCEITSNSDKSDIERSFIKEESIRGDAIFILKRDF